MDGRSASPATSEGPQAARERLWLACRGKTCCHDARVVVGGRDLWRIAMALEVAPWVFTEPAPAEPGAAGAFRLEPGGAPHQVVLARRRRTAAAGAPCVFLWKLGDGHAQCGLGSLRPLACRDRPAAPAGRSLRGAGPGCTCGPWPDLGTEHERDAALREATRRETVEYEQVVGAWHRGAAREARRTYRDFCSHVMAAYREMA